MNCLNRKRRLLLLLALAACLNAATFLPTNCLAFQDDEQQKVNPAVELYAISRINDVVQNPITGEVDFLSYFHGPSKPSGTQVESLVDSGVLRGASKTFVKYLKHPTDKDSTLMVAWLGADRKNGIGFYSYKSGKLRFESHIGERMRSPTIYQSKRGDVFVGSRSGVIYWRKTNGEFLRYQVPFGEGQEPDFSKMFREIHFAESPSGIVCAYSIVNPKYHKRALFNVVVADPQKGWRTVELGKRVTGPAVMTNESTLSMLLYDRFVNIDIQTAEVTETEFPVPREGDARVSPVSLHLLPDGTLLSCWRKMYRSFKPYDVDPFADGFYQRVCQWQPKEGESPISDGGNWEVVAGKDRLITKRVVEVTDSAGGWWIAAGEGSVLYRSPTGGFRYLSFHDGLSTYPIESLRSFAGNLWSIQDRSVIKLDIAKLLASSKKAEGRWREAISESATSVDYWIPQADARPIVTTSDRIICISTPQVDYPMPETSMFDREPKYFVFEDRKQKPWLISSKDEYWYLAGWVDGKWQRFDLKKQTNRDRYEVMAEWLMKQGIVKQGDRIGSRIEYGPGGRIAVRVGEEGNRVQLFDGERWFAGFEDELVEDSAIRAITFGSDAIQAYLPRNIVYHLPFERWPASMEKLPTWSPFTSPITQRNDYRRNREWVQKMARSSPLKGKLGVWNTSNKASYVSFTPQQMAIGDETGWTTIDVENSPLATRHWIGRFARHRSGNLVFAVNGAPVTRYFIFDAKVPSIAVVQPDLGEVDDVDSVLHPKWEASSELVDVRIRFRVDNGLWSKWQNADKPVQPGMVPTKGKHELQLQLQSGKTFLPKETFRYWFNVSYDRSGAVDDLIAKLSAADFDERKQAERDLIKLGPNIVGYLQDKYESTTRPETKVGLKKVIDSHTKRDN